MNVWIDWKKDGDFNDTFSNGATERIYTDHYVASATNYILMALAPPVEDRLGDGIYYHRWRITSYNTFGALTHLGLATNGEVEDYMDDEILLAVELTTFTAKAVDGGMELNCTTESETENLGFILEKRTAGGNWAELASYKITDALLGQGSTQSYKDYE
ncbi:GEVED domain-containing protein [Candidatus Neomarinimicrobiota bacterium]